MGYPDGFNIEKPLGQNNADNAYDSSLVTQNEDGSVLERLEHLKGSNNNVASKALTTIANGNTTLFNYTGNIRIKAIYGVVTTLTETKTTNIKLAVVSDSLEAYDICANKDCTALGVGTLISITGTAANAAVATTVVGAIAPFQVSEVIATSITSGLIRMVAGDANTGKITWYIQWEPLSAGATLTAA